MAGSLMVSCVRSSSRTVGLARMSSTYLSYGHKVGNREIVGYGINGEASYIDHHAFPMPAVRFKEITPDLQALKEKEKGDWKKLSIEEKKELYRASFCQTLVELEAPTGEWKSIVGIVLMIVSTALWMYIGAKKFVYEPLPITFSDEYQLAQLERIRLLDMNPITGINKRK